MSLRLTSNTHAACCGEDVVLLDLTAGSYACLPGCGPLIALRPASSSLQVRDLDLAKGLLAIGAAEAGEGAPRVAAPPAERDLSHPAQIWLSPADGGAMLACLGDLALSYWRAPFGRLIQTAQSRRIGACGEERAIAAAAQAFQHMLPWVPAQGVCLYRSFFLLSFLRRRGLSASWVFGVQTYTFEAHCWLQAGDLVLDDHLEHVRGFAPILALEP